MGDSDGRSCTRNMTQDENQPCDHHEWELTHCTDAFGCTTGVVGCNRPKLLSLLMLSSRAKQGSNIQTYSRFKELHYITRVKSKVLCVPARLILSNIPIKIQNFRRTFFIFRYFCPESRGAMRDYVPDPACFLEKMSLRLV